MPHPRPDDSVPPADRPLAARPPRLAAARPDAPADALANGRADAMADAVAVPPPVRWRLPTDPPPA